MSDTEAMAATILAMLQEAPGRPSRIASEAERARLDTKRMMVRNANASRVYGSLAELTPVEPWPRPPEVPSNDIEAANLRLAVKRKGEKANPDDRESVYALGRWTYELDCAECKSAANLLLILETLETYYEIDDPTVDDRIQELRDHVMNHWSADVDDSPIRTGASRRVLEAWARQVCRDEKLCPTWLLGGHAPPNMFVPPRKKTELGTNPFAHPGVTAEDFRD